MFNDRYLIDCTSNLLDCTRSLLDCTRFLFDCTRGLLDCTRYLLDCARHLDYTRTRRTRPRVKQESPIPGGNQPSAFNFRELIPPQTRTLLILFSLVSLSEVTVYFHFPTTLLPTLSSERASTRDSAPRFPPDLRNPVAVMLKLVGNAPVLKE